MLRISSIRKKITPPVGTHLAGYGKNVVSDGVHDDLFISGISFDDGQIRTILLSYDLLGLDADLVQSIRIECAKAAGIQPENIVLTCTHTHSGPHTRSLAIRLRDQEYADKLVEYSKQAVSKAFDQMAEVSVLHYSLNCYENVNRRNARQYMPLPPSQQAPDASGQRHH